MGGPRLAGRRRDKQRPGRRARRGRGGPLILAEPERRELWRLAYRLTGLPEEADEVVQEVALRAWRRPPDLDRPTGPWLRAVTLNLARDRYRRRRRRAYVGPWLPIPIDLVEAVAPDLSPEARLSQHESLSYSFLVALEALTPQQRLVLVARDVLGWSGEETAQQLGLQLPNVKVTLHRARKALAGWEAARPLRADRHHLERLLHQLIAALGANDLDQVAALFEEASLSLTDGGGQVFAARVPLRGPTRIARVLLKLAYRRPLRWMTPRLLNGELALVGAFEPRPGEPTAFVQFLQVGPGGKLAGLTTLVAPDKLRQLPSDVVPGVS